VAPPSNVDALLRTRTVNNMGKGPRWWRAQLSPYLISTTVDWFDRTHTYPGRLLERHARQGTVRLFRDLEAFETEDDTVALDIPIAWLDEVESPR
jgi:hypothetical protein